MKRKRGRTSFRLGKRCGSTRKSLSVLLSIRKERDDVKRGGSYEKGGKKFDWRSREVR